MNSDYRTFARIGHFHSDTLLEISIDSFLKFELLKDESEKLKKEGYFEYNGDPVYNEKEKIDIIEYSLLKESIKVIVFLGAFMESYFFDLSAVALGQQYTENHIERLDLASKIIIIPRLITGKEINKSSHFWREIKNLIKWRNKIIHNKTKDSTEFLKNVKSGKYEPKSLYEEFNMLTFLKSIKLLFEELDKIDPKGLHTLRINWKMERISSKLK